MSITNQVKKQFFDKDVFKLTLLFLMLVELLSFFGWLAPWLNALVFVAIAAVTLALALYKLEYGLLILLAELFVGSKGYLFSWQVGGTLISIRVALFLVVMAVWLAKFILGERRKNIFSPRNEEYQGLVKPFILLFIVIAWALAWGIIRGNNFGDVFLDFNNWLYFLLIFPVYWVVASSRDTTNCVSPEVKNNFIKNILSVLAGATVWLGIKSLILLYIFSHQLNWALPEVYKWVRDTGVGEITLISNGFYRIFIQSQIYALLLFFIFLPVCGIMKARKVENGELQDGGNTVTFEDWHIKTPWLVLIICATTVLLSFSRSYWVGLGVGWLFYCFITLFLFKVKFLQLLKSIGIMVIILGVSGSIIWAIINLPPIAKPGNDLVSLISQRTTQVEAAGSSRLSMLGPLLKKISQHPLIGSGFGTTLTYRTYDPRIISTTAGGSGEFTAYAFEWGYLDMILKFGLLGTGAYLFLIYQILKGLLKSTNRNLEFQALNNNYLWQFGFAMALGVLLVVNVFSPYLNHPLGIGFIIISLALINRQF